MFTWKFGQWFEMGIQMKRGIALKVHLKIIIHTCGRMDLTQLLEIRAFFH